MQTYNFKAVKGLSIRGTQYKKAMHDVTDEMIKKFFGFVPARTQEKYSETIAVVNTDLYYQPYRKGTFTGHPQGIMTVYAQDGQWRIGAAKTPTFFIDLLHQAIKASVK